MPEAARERLATPPAGAALAPEPRYAFAAGPFTERESLGEYVTNTVTIVNDVVTTIIAVMPGPVPGIHVLVPRSKT